MKKVVICSSLFLSFLSLIFLAADVRGQATPTVRLQLVLSDLFSPVFTTSARDGSRRLFVVELGGTIKVVQPGATTATNFLNISSKISTGGERGLLGLAFHPQFSQNRRFFVYYTRVGDGALQIGEFQASAGNPNVADTTEKVIISIPHSTNNNHNGGTIAFGADGYLYLAPGDGGGANDVPNNAQNINQLLGKVLRIDINVPANSTTPYLIPPDNPFAGATPGADEIYAVGMRNPYRFSFDRGGTNQLWVGDVGQNSLEEIDIIVKGGNYGWRIMEGSQCTPTINSNCTPPAGHIPPVFEYSSAGAGGRCSVTGGNVYRGTRGTVPNGAYIYGDYCSGEIFLWNNNQQNLLLDTDRFISSFGEDEDGEIYVTGLLSGTVEKVVREGVTLQKAPFDFDGDNKTDISIFRPSTTEWWYLRSSDGGNRTFQFGRSNDEIVPADYTGDGKTDIAVWRPSTGEWFVLRSEDNSFYSFPFGALFDTPVPADYDGDGRTDAAVVRYNSTSGNFTWFIQRSTGGVTIQSFGTGGDYPVPSDYDGDGKADIAIYRGSNGQWWINRSSAGLVVYQFGIGTDNGGNPDTPVQGDYTGDGKTDVAVFRRSTGEWFILRSENNSFYSFPFGASGDTPLPGDYDGDGKTDAAVARGNGQGGLVWYVQRSSAGILIQNFGIIGDMPVPRAYIPSIAVP